MAKKGQRASDSATAGDEGSAAERILADYLAELQSIRASGAGVQETSFYPALSNLFNAVGKTLKPKVRCIIHTRNQGAGIPDGGLFTADQFQRQSGDAPKPGQLPARGAIEAKGTKPAIEEVAALPQVAEYLRLYGIVLITNLRSFALVDRGPDGRPVQRESFHLAANEPDFWRRTAAHPRAAAKEQGAPFIEFVKRACLHAAPLTRPKDLAWFLASYARDALYRVEQKRELPALQAVRAALEEALGMKFTAEKGEHFFRSTLVQTLFYGVFSSWVRWHRDNPSATARFDWRTAEWSLHVPIIRVLYEEVAKPSRLGPLGLVELLDWTAGALNRVLRDEFFQNFDDEQAVQYFYEPFLEAYDPDLRKELGVWYTPREIVKYQVARVDTVLRQELGLDDGLADPNVMVLDPCCGTGAYLVEVLHRIAATLRDKGGDGLVASDLKRAAIERVFGFEIMPAPFVVSHLQLGLMLRAQGAPLAQEERVGVYLTNALTGWAPPKGPKQTLMSWTELQEERDAAEHVKRDKKILVVLGNPPYNAFAGVSPQEEEGLVDPYKEGLNKPTSAGGWGIKKFNLDDLYVRFFRLAERRIAEMSGQGVISFISNFSYLSDPSFVVMRQRFLAEFDKLWFDSLNGDSRETGKLTPEGKPDPSVFSTDHNREGIRVGTAVCVLVRKPTRDGTPVIRFRDFWGVSKRSDLLASLKARRLERSYTLARPGTESRFSFRPENVAASYNEWPSVVRLCAVEPISGLQEMRKGSLMDTVRDQLAQRIQAYFDKSLDWAEFSALGSGLAMDGGDFNAEACRDKLLSVEVFDNGKIRPYSLYPFDLRWCYHTNTRPLWNRSRPALAAQCWTGNRFFVTRPFAERPNEWATMTITSALPDYHLLRPNAVAIPLRLRDVPTVANGIQQNGLFDSEKSRANLSEAAREYLRSLGRDNPDSRERFGGLIWMHALAIGYSPAYLSDNADGVRRDWPRIPLPDTREALEASAELGERVAALLDTEARVTGVTSGAISPLLKTIGVISRVGGGSLDPSAGDLEVTVGWGHGGQGGIVMPAKGRIEDRAHHQDETDAIHAEAANRAISADEIRSLLGATTCDVFLNGRAYWRNLPRNVWEYRIGGYQVVKKWLSYREREVLGRSLTPDEAREVMNMVRRLTEIILLQPRLDENYRRVAAAAFDWSRVGGK